MICDAGDVAVAAFPYVDRKAIKGRPVLVLSRADRNEALGEAVVAMITTAARSQWPDDEPISDWVAAGLKGPSVVRPRLTSIANGLIATRIGALAEPDRDRAAKAVRSVVAL